MSAHEYDSKIQSIPIDQIRLGTSQEHQHYDEAFLRELADSFREKGIITPLFVHRVGDHYWLVRGERRFRAARLAGMTEVPCVVSFARWW